MNKTGVGFLALLLTGILLLSACGGQAAERDSESGNGTQSTDTPLTKNPDTLPALSAEGDSLPDIENNGGQFVRVNHRVYFRHYGENAVETTALWGEFLDTWPLESGSSELCCYDENTGTVESVCADDSNGSLWYGIGGRVPGNGQLSGGFYLTRVTEGLNYAYFLSLDTYQVTELQDGRVAGSSPNGVYAVIEATDGQKWSALNLYEGMEQIAKVEPDPGEYLEYCGVNNDGVVIFHCHSYAEETDTLWQLNPDASAVLLGTFPSREDDLIPELEQILWDADTVYGVFLYRDGTAHALADSLCLRAQLGTAESMEQWDTGELEEEESAYEGEENFPKLFLAEPGDVVNVPEIPMRAFLSRHSYGDLSYSDSPFSAMPLVAGFIPRNPYEDGGSVVQTIEVVGDAVYAIVAEASRDEGTDVGWRLSFRLNSLSYLRIPLETGPEGSDAEVQVLFGQRPGGSGLSEEEKAEIYASFLGTWDLKGGETEGDRWLAEENHITSTIEILPEYRAKFYQKIGGSGYDGEEIVQDVEFFPVSLEPMYGFRDGAYAISAVDSGEAETRIYGWIDEDDEPGALWIIFEATLWPDDVIGWTGYYTRRD